MILLSFDTEEFDVPREHGVDFSLEEGMKVSVYGTNKILDTLKDNGVKATFFCTGNFAENAPEVKTQPEEAAVSGQDSKGGEESVENSEAETEQATEEEKPADGPL